MMETFRNEENPKHGGQGSYPDWCEDGPGITPAPGVGVKLGARASAARSSKSGVQAKAQGKPRLHQGTKEVNEHLPETRRIKRTEIRATREEQQCGQESTPPYGSTLRN